VVSKARKQPWRAATRCGLGSKTDLLVLVLRPVIRMRQRPGVVNTSATSRQSTQPPEPGLAQNGRRRVAREARLSAPQRSDRGTLIACLHASKAVCAAANIRTRRLRFALNKEPHYYIIVNAGTPLSAAHSVRRISKSVDGAKQVDRLANGTRHAVCIESPHPTNAH
jgi:hypothetical protein